MALNEAAQDFQDDLDMWGESSASVALHDENGDIITDLGLTPTEVRVMFEALRDFHAAL